MDVAKYIGLFLLKNQYCYIHGLGNLELKKRPASFTGEVLQSGTYEVVLGPSGSIDDNLANFIATNEQISISKASNALRDFSTQAKIELNEGRAVEIPSMGKFVQAENKITFVTDPQFQYTPPGIPSMRSSRRLEDDADTMQTATPAPRMPVANETYRPSLREPAPGVKLNWNRIILVAVLLLVVLIGALYVVRYMKSRGNAAPETTMQTIPVDTPHNAPMDTTGISAIDTANPAAQPMVTFKVILDTYDNRKKAEKRTAQMKGYGHNVEMVIEDSNTFLIIMPVQQPVHFDTTKVLDSMSRLYNPTGVTIY